MEHSEEKKGLSIALSGEMQSLIDTGTYDINEKIDMNTIARQVIGHSKLIFSRKYDAEGKFVKFKCRIVFRGDRWIDHFRNKTYSGTVKSESVKLLLSIAAAKGLINYFYN
jgi:hypothetical protein